MNNRLTLPCEREIEVIIAVVPILLQEFSSLTGTFQPLGFFLYLIVEHSEHPDFPALQPNELIGVKHAAITVQAGEITAVFIILRLFQPKRQNLVVQLIIVLVCQLSKIDFCIIHTYNLRANRNNA